MVDTYTPSLRLTEPEISANNDAWAALLNAGMIALLDDAIAGETVIDVTGGNVTLTENDGASDEARAMFIRVIGTPGVTRNVITTLGGAVPSKLYIVTNNSDGIVNIGPAPGTALSIDPGQITMCYADVAAGGMFEIASEGDVVQSISGNMGTLTLDILPTPGGGDVTVAAEFFDMGSFIFLTFDEFLSTAVPGTTFSVLPTSGDWNTSGLLTPQVVKSFPMLLYEDTGGGMVRTDSIITVTSTSTQPWQITKVDGTAYTNPSGRQQLRPQTVFYPLQSNV